MKMTAYLLAVVVILCAAPAIAQGPFNDVPTDHWAYDAVNTLQRDGIVIGYPDGTFGGKRAMSRYEFAVAIARLVPMLNTGTGPAAGVSNAELQKILSDYAKKSDIPDISKLATKADVDAIRKLVDEFGNELAALGVDVDALKRDVCALTARVDALEAEMRRVRFSGDVNVFAIASDEISGFEAQDLDQRTIAADATLGRTISVVKDFDLNVVGRVSDSTTANATINYGNYLNYLTMVDDYINSPRPVSTGVGLAGSTGSTARNTLSDNFFPYYLYINTTLAGGALSVGRFPLQFTPYTLKKIDVDSYTSILKTDSGNYPMDGALLSSKFCGVDITLFAAKNNTNDYLFNGLTGQPNIGLFTDTGGPGTFGAGKVKPGYDFFAGTGLAGVAGHAVGGLASQIAQTAGGRFMFGTPWKGNLGATYYQSWSQIAFNDPAQAYDQARVFGADLTIPFGNFGFAGSWTQSETLAQDNTGAANLNDNNTAWDARINGNFGKLYADAGYKNIERQFAAAGSWDKIGRWTNPTDVKGPYADLSYPISSNIKFVANGEFLKLIDPINANAAIFGQADDEIIKAEGGIRWGISKANSLDLGYQWIKYSPQTAGTDDAFETYLTIGWAHQLNAGTGFKIGYQFIGYNDGDTASGPYDVTTPGAANNDYRAGQGVVQFGVTF